MNRNAQSTPHPATLVRRHTMERIEHFLAGRDLDVYQGLRSVSTQVSESYRSRVVVELIQNAHDAHPPQQDKASGRIAVALDESEGPHGHLYVANAGLGFTPNNFSKLCGVATSTKLINEGIGYKGIGFLSVFQASAHPEIYSASGRAAIREDFDGFRFCIPDEALLRRELVTLKVAQHETAIAGEMPRILLPVSIEVTPDPCRAFASEGYATVVRLPLKNDEARVAVHDQIVILNGADMPLHLFLNRLSEISVSIRGGDDVLERRLRRVSQAAFHEDGLDISEIEVSDDVRFLIIAMTLPRAEFIGVIEEDVEAERIASDWVDWRGDANIAVALPVDGLSIDSRLYNFLPMSDEARSPFPGHLNAPFHTSIDRRSLTENVRLNEFLLDQSAELCVRAAEALRDRGHRHAVYAVPDLLCWRDHYRQRMYQRLVTREIEIANCRFAPVLGSKGRGISWRTFGEARVWQDECKLLSPARIAREAKARVLTPTLGAERIKRLEAFCAPDVDLRPDLIEVAEWVVEVARKLHARHNKRHRYAEWNSFYRALERLFRDSPEVLFGRRIMLAANDRLVLAENPEERPRRRRKREARIALFFPPIRGAERRLKQELPPAVQRRINFLHPNLECSRERSEHAEVRRFLEHSQLVRRHDAREFLRVLASAMASPGRIKDVDSFRWSALQVALDMVEPVDIGSWLGELHVSVPTQGGWISADGAYLGSKWAKQTGRRSAPGRDLEDLVARAHDQSREIASLEDAFIAPLSDWHVKTRDRSRWRQFLVACGALDHLRPVRIGRGRPPKVNGGQLAGSLLRWSGLNEQSQDLWRQTLAPANKALPNLQTPYIAEVPVWRLPGQDDYRAFSSDVRSLYARQVIDLLNTFGGAVTTFHVHRPDHPQAPNRIAWPTPIASFLMQETWVPVAQSGGGKTYVEASAAWVYERDTARRPLEFLDFTTSEFLDVLDDCVEASALLKERFHLHSMKAKNSAIPLVQLLGTAASKGRVHQDELATFEKLYERAWNNALAAVDAGAEPPKPSHLAAVEAGRLVAFPTAVDADDIERNDDGIEGSNMVVNAVWLDDASSPLPGHMLAEAGKPVFPFRLDKGERVAAWLVELFPSLIKRASETDVVIQVDDMPFEPSAEAPALVDVFGSWLPEFVAVAADLRARFARLKSEQLTAKVRRMRLQRVERISVKIGDETAPLPEFAHGCLFCDDAEAPTIVYEERAGEHGFELLSRLSNTLDEGLGGRSQLGTALSAGALKLAQLYEEASTPSDGDYAMIFSQPVTRVQRVLALVRGELDQVLYWLRPLIWITGGREAVDDFDAMTTSARTEDDVRVALGRLKRPLPPSDDDLIAASKVAIDGASLVRRLKLSLARYNEAVDALGSRYRSMDFSTEHANTFTRFVADRRRQLRESLRVHFLQAFDADADLSNYVAIRDNTPEPDTAWGTAYLELPEEVMKDWLVSNLTEAGIALIEEEGWHNPPFTETREANRVTLESVAEQATPIVQAWCQKGLQPVPKIWSEPDVARSLAGIAHDGGWLDFRPLAVESILTRLQACGAWPEAMPLTLSMKELRLSKADLRAEETRARKQREQEARARRSVTVDGHEIVEDETPGHEVAALIDSLLAQNERLRKSKFRTARLKRVAVSQDDRGIGNGRGGPGGGGRQLPEAKRQLIGFIGELIAFEWLKLHFGKELVTEDCWVSRNRERIYPGEGNDNKGYDFVVPTKKTEWHFEVKATASVKRLIELGITEISDAERCRADRTPRYRILFIENALEPQAATLHMLPNPRSARGKSRFRRVSRTGVKLTFDL